MDSGRVALVAVPATLASLVVLAAVSAVVWGPGSAVPLDDEASRSEELEPQLMATSNYVSPSEVTRLEAEADAGDAEAQYKLAIVLLDRYEREGDIALQRLSQERLVQAAEQDHADAQTEIGNWYLSGRGVVQDFSQAAGWFQKAASLGSAKAMYGLGEMARAGWGIEKDPIEAYVWLNLASARGEKRAHEARRQVINQLTAEQLTEAQRRSRELDQNIPQTSS